MSSFRIDWPERFEEYEWLIDAKGWCQVEVINSDNRYTIVFYDLVRLRQEVEDEHKLGRAFFEQNLVIIETVDRRHIEEAVAQLMTSGAVKRLRPDPSES